MLSIGGDQTSQASPVLLRGGTRRRVLPMDGIIALHRVRRARRELRGRRGIAVELGIAGYNVCVLGRSTQSSQMAPLG